MAQFGSSMRAYPDREAHHHAHMAPQHVNPAMKEFGQTQHPQLVAPACGDVKPRLTKEQHDILEAHFQQQHKPSTSTKKGFAESLGVPVDKINVRIPEAMESLC